MHAIKTEIIEVSEADEASGIDAVVRLHLIFEGSPDAPAICRTERVHVAPMPNRPRRLKHRIRNLAVRQSEAYFRGDSLTGDENLFTDLPIAPRQRNLATLDDAALLNDNTWDDCG